jgi:hypothetical protein
MVTLDFPQSQIFEQLFNYFNKDIVTQLEERDSARNLALIIKVLYSVFKKLNLEKAHISNFHNIYLINYFNAKLDVVRNIINSIIDKIFAINQHLKEMPKQALEGLMSEPSFYNQAEEKISFDCLKYAVKFCNLENYICSTKEEFDIKLCITQMDCLQNLVFLIISGLFTQQFTNMKSDDNIYHL